MNQDLKTRIPVAIIYVAVIAAMTMLGQLGSVILLFLFFALCIQEFVSISGKGNRLLEMTIYSSSFILSILTILPISKKIELLPVVVISSTLFLINIFYLLIVKKSLTNTTPKFAASAIYIVLPFIISMSAAYRYELFPKVLLGVFIILWLNDAGAYFVGKSIGKRKLFPVVSPKKTWEGFFGGGIAGFLISLAIAPVLGVLDTRTWLFIALIVWITGTFGDLVESLWKRYHKIKDSGTIMRGHGGFLDRLDSFIYAIPFVILFFECLIV